MTATPEQVDAFIARVLDAIEQVEAGLLVWGIVDGRMTAEELARTVTPVLDKAYGEGMDAFVDPEEVVGELRRRALVVETDDTPYPGYRSRMAETVRLVFRLRQLFSKHARDDQWQNAATLVADFRFLWRRRRYPDRNLPPAEALRRLSSSTRDEAAQRAMAQLLADRHPNFGLAGFQLRAAERILSALYSRQASGTLVSAGTGSGKTLAFYLPALARTASNIMRDATAWVKVLALYPRTELLRDQFAEIYAEARRLDDMLAGARRRPIRVGCLYAGTPRDAASIDPQDPPTGWRRHADGVTCGFISCPECDSDLLWRDADRAASREHLECITCGHEIGGDKIALTRATMRRSPPDLLFTTTEMLNQRMGDDYVRHLFGLGVRKPVEMVLLDEVHYYTGSSGAQAAYLFRRWQHLSKSPVCIVGLSATVRDGASFFQKLTGLPDTSVVEIKPEFSEMIDEGAEHMLALRGDPVSRTSLLSTTIQTAMLVMRALDNPAAPTSRGLYGTRTFAFTDDLDVTNRLYFSLLDAEGRDDFGNPDMRRYPAGPLAVLRTPTQSRSRERYGQNWSMPILAGHQLRDRKKITRTSSQDPGVSFSADLIVATASLEVGFNDQTVGAVLQHKAPRGSAQFLQRKGRAGRSRSMRPWTIVVLSDYGRDRLAYQGYDRLFDPELPPQSLPLASRHIRKIQSVYSLVDYLGSAASHNRPRGNTWWDLSAPREGNQRRERFEYLIRTLNGILDDPTETEALVAHLIGALGLPDHEIQPLLWEHPRPLMTTVIPTAVRRLGTNWRRGDQPRGDYRVFNSPLPEYTPGQLFGDLNLPEVAVIVPTGPRGANEDHAMAVTAALREFAPGRVSRRFGARHGSIRHWVGPNAVPAAGNADIRIDDFYEFQHLGIWQLETGNGLENVQVFRPHAIRPARPPANLKDSSNARLDWTTQIVTDARGVFQNAPRGTPWGNVLTGIESFLHAEQTPVEYRRFALTSQASLNTGGQAGIRVTFSYRSGQEACALGFSQHVDAIRLKLSIPPDLWRRSSRTSAQMWRALRTEKFLDDAASGEALHSVENPFARRWLAEIYLAALTFQAISAASTLDEADAALRNRTAALDLADVLDAIFQSAAPDDDAAHHAVQNGSDRLRQEIEQFLRRDDVRNGLHDHGRLLWEPVTENWEPWLRDRFKATVGAAAMEAIRNLCPDVGEEGLVLDCTPGPRIPEDALPHDDAGEEVWIAETSPGSTGLIETILGAYAEDPRRFYLLMAAALRPTEHELVDHQLVTTLQRLNETPPGQVKIAVDAYRATRSFGASSDAMVALRHELRRESFGLFHGFVSALANRILRPGTGDASDRFLNNAVVRWETEEERLGIEIDASAISYALAQDDEIEQVMIAAGMNPPTDNVLSWRRNAIYGVLWPRGALIRRNRLDLYNPYAQLPPPERLLVAEFLTEGSTRLELIDPAWREQIAPRLAESGAVTFICPVTEPRLLAEALSHLTTNPIVSDYLSVYASLGTLRRVEDVYEADIELAEFAQ